MAILNLDNTDNLFGPTNSSDTIAGNGGDDTINGGGGRDLLLGGKGEDLLKGGTGKDTLFGGKDNDALFGGSGKDILSGDSGADILTGGSGIDTFVFNANSIDAVDTITDFASNETIALIGNITNADGVQDGGNVNLFADVNGVTTLIAVIENAMEVDVDASFALFTSNADLLG
ncbi:MAG: hypothetical protein AAF748_01770 [Pseudomonadota bacterium]